MDAHTTVPEVVSPSPIESICQINAAPVTIVSAASTRCSPGDESVPELIAIAAVAGLHLWKRNVLLSIAGGTVLYMVLVQAVFV